MKIPKKLGDKLPVNSRKKVERVRIRQLPSGVRGLDQILGGGFPEFSCNLIAGAPGGGKTTLAHQIAFANATLKKPALYLTILGESALKMLRYQQQFTFFDATRVGRDVHFVNLADLVLKQNLDSVLEEITQRITALKPGVVIVDSFRTLLRGTTRSGGDAEMQSFIHRLTLFLASWQATTFLIGEYSEEEVPNNPLFTMVDGIVWLLQTTERNSVVRQMRIMKLRGQKSVPGLHTVRITDEGMQTFSRTLGMDGDGKSPARQRRLSTGIRELDRMMGGGILEGNSLLITGPTGTGKSALATQFIAAGLSRGEPGIMAIFEERPQGYLQRAQSFGLDLKAPQKKGELEILYLRPLDLTVDETLQEILDAVKRVGAKRLVIDSLVGFEMALAPGFRMEFRESLYRMICALTGAGITIVSTVEVEDTFNELSFSHYGVSFLTDDIIRLRYVEIEGQLRKVILIIKTRGGNHQKDIREYVITNQGVVIVHPSQTGYYGLITGIPRRDSSGQFNEPAPEPKVTT